VCVLDANMRQRSAVQGKAMPCHATDNERENDATPQDYTEYLHATHVKKTRDDALPCFRLVPTCYLFRLVAFCWSSLIGCVTLVSVRNTVRQDVRLWLLVTQLPSSRWACCKRGIARTSGQPDVNSPMYCWRVRTLCFAFFLFVFCFFSSLALLLLLLSFACWVGWCTNPSYSG